MAPHTLILACGLVALGVLELLVYVEKSRRVPTAEKRPSMRSHPVLPRLQRMP